MLDRTRDVDGFSQRAVGAPSASGAYFTYLVSARTMASVTVSPRSAARSLAADHRSSETRTPRTLVLGRLGTSDQPLNVNASGDSSGTGVE